MKIIKGTLLIACITVLDISIFAQESFKKEATQGLFSTDVDNYMDVNNWSEIGMENFFGFLGYNHMAGETSHTHNVGNYSGNSGNISIGDGGLDTINTGLSHSVGKVYTGLYFGGRLKLFDFKSKSFIDYNNPKNNNKTSSLETKTGGVFDMGLLFGNGNVGVKPYVRYSPKGISNTTSKNNDGSVKSDSKNFNVRPGLQIGINSKIKGHVARFNLGSSIDCNINKIRNKNIKGEITKSDNSSYGLSIYSGVEFDGKESESGKFSSVWGVDLGITLSFYKSVNGNNKIKGKFDSINTINPYFVAIITPAERFALKIKPEVKFCNITHKNPKSIINTKIGKTEYLDPYKNFGISMAPRLSVGGVFTIKKEVVDFNFGASIDIPNVEWSKSVSETCNHDTGELLTKTTETNFNFNTGTGKLGLSSGVTAYIGKAVTFDISWNILGRLVPEKLKSDFNNGNDSNAFWGNLNKIFFGSNIGLLLSVKI